MANIKVADKNKVSCFIDSNNSCAKIIDISETAVKQLNETLENKRMEFLRKKLLKKLEETATIAKQLSEIYYHSNTIYSE